MIAGIICAAVGYKASWGPYPPVAPFGKRPLPSQRVVVPMFFPVLGKVRFGKDYGANRGSHLHTGIDIKAPKRTPVIAPFSGVIGLKKQSFWILGDNGWSVLGTHLNDDRPGRNDNSANRDLMFAPNVLAGGRVAAGQLIGYVGDSGQATGPHLHFELYAPGHGDSRLRVRNPFWSLKYAQRRSSPKPVIPDYAEKPTEGQIRMIGVVRKVVPQRREVTLLLTAKQFSTGKTVAYSSPRYMKVRLPEMDTAVPNWDQLQRMDRFDLLSAYGTASNGMLIASNLRAWARPAP